MEQSRKNGLEKYIRGLGVKHVTLEMLNLVNQSLTHASFVNESKNKNIEHNERLEFLGDAVLNLAISQYLYCTYPDFSEGELTRIRAGLVCESCLAEKAKMIHLGEYMLLGKGEEATGGRIRPSLLANTFEALLGAIYLQESYEIAFDFIIHLFKEELDRIQPINGFYKDPKTTLQEYVQKEKGLKVIYEVVEEAGPDHDKRFSVIVRLADKIVGRGQGRSKKEAEQNAALEAINRLGIQ